MGNPVESVLSLHFPEVYEKIKCIDFGIKDYLSAEMKDSDEESSGSGDFNNSLNVEPQTLRMETDTESPLLFLDEQTKKKALVKKHLGFLRGGSSDSNAQVDDTGPNDMSTVHEKSIGNRLLPLNSQELAIIDSQQVDADLSIVEDVGQGSGLSSPMSDSDENARMVETLK